MTEAAAAPALRERGWRYVILAFAAFVLVPVVPEFRAILPIERTLLLLVPALAVCSLIGWWAGGRFVVALAWGLLAVWVVVRSTPESVSQYASLASGWSLLAAGAFGIVCLLAATASFLPRALSALGLALGVALALAAFGVVRPDRATRVLAEQYEARNSAEVARRDTLVRELPAEWSRIMLQWPGGRTADLERRLTILSRGALYVFPALLALESLAALALAWSLYHRLSRVRIGAPLARLRDFRFSDQLVWTVLVAAAVLLLPSLAPLRGLGLNLFTFFGALYAIRGFGVLVWFLASAGTFALGGLIASAVLLFPAVTALALGLGFGDTWIDWRGRARSSTGSTL